MHRQKTSVLIVLSKYNILDPGSLNDSILKAITWQGGFATLFTIALLAASAFISSSEVAFFSLSPNDYDKLDKANDTKSKNIKELLSRPDYLLATILISNTLVNIAIITFSSFAINSFFDFSANKWLGFLIETVVITFLLLLFGEIMPKIMATQNSLKSAKRASTTLKRLNGILKPFDKVLVSSTSIVNKQLAKNKHNNISINELSQALELTSDTIDDEKNILKGIVNFGNTSTAQVMTSRMDMVTINIKSPFSEILEFIIKNEFSRIPVFSDNIDDIRGILYIKDLIPHLTKGDSFRWQTLIRPAYFVPETKKIDNLLQEFQKNRIHIAIVIDEFGGTSGLVTMEDILEEVIGNIDVEFDEDEPLYVRQNENTYVFEGKILLTDFFKATDIDPELFSDYLNEVDTLAGFILELKGEMPQINEKIRYKNFLFEILDVDARRISKIKLIIKKKKNENQSL